MFYKLICVSISLAMIMSGTALSLGQIGGPGGGGLSLKLTCKSYAAGAAGRPLHCEMMPGTCVMYYGHCVVGGINQLYTKGTAMQDFDIDVCTFPETPDVNCVQIGKTNCLQIKMLDDNCQQKCIIVRDIWTCT